jgi:hypothetical protein
MIHRLLVYQLIEVFLNREGKDLFERTIYKDIEDNLTSAERKALTEFQSVSVEDRDWIIRMQDKGK